MHRCAQKQGKLGVKKLSKFLPKIFQGSSSPDYDDDSEYMQMCMHTLMMNLALNAKGSKVRVILCERRIKVSRRVN